jgi:hypothetical protein
MFAPSGDMDVRQLLRHVYLTVAEVFRRIAHGESRRVFGSHFAARGLSLFETMELKDATRKPTWGQSPVTCAVAQKPLEAIFRPDDDRCSLHFLD